MTTTCETTEADVDRLEKLEKAYNHFNYAERFRITFNDYVRKVEAGTWGELAADHRSEVGYMRTSKGGEIQDAAQSLPESDSMADHR